MSIFSRLTKTNSTGQASLQNNLSASSAPTVNDDSGEGYAVGSLWIDTTGDEAYRCVDATEGSAVWVKTTLDATEFATVMASTINTATGKTTPVDADEVALVDSEASNVLKKLTWANIKATLVTYFDTLYAPVLGADDNYVTDAEKVVIGNTSGTNTGDEASASTTVAGVSELATVAEVDAGSDTGRTITPDALAGSVFGTKTVVITPFGSDEAVVTGNGTIAFTVPSSMNGMNLVNVVASVHTKGITGTTDVQVRARTGGVDSDMLSTKITLGDEFFASDEVIDGANDDIATGDQIYIDVDTVHSGTAPNGLSVALEFRLP